MEHLVCSVTVWRIVVADHVGSLASLNVDGSPGAHCIVNYVAVLKIRANVEWPKVFIIALRLDGDYVAIGFDCGRCLAST
jgi:hypothetical protein